MPISRSVRLAAVAAAGQATGAGTPGSTGFVFAAAGAHINDGAGALWQNPGNITASDNARATANSGGGSGATEILYATFDLSSVPDASTITGVEVRVEKDYSSTLSSETVRDHTLRLTKDGSAMVGDNKADTGTNWPHSSSGEDTITYGGAADLWGTTLTPAEVKAATFGVMLKADHVSPTVSNTARVDHIAINIHYET